jgi:3'-5' exoribonuclease
VAGKAFISDIRDRLERKGRSFPVSGTFLVQDKQVPLNKNGTPYLALVLQDRDGTINAKMWDNVEITVQREAFSAGDFVRVDCEAQTYRGNPQLKVKKLTKVPTPDDDALSDFLGSAAHSPQKMLGEVRTLLDGLQHAGLRRMLLARLDEPAFSEALARAPAAKTHHHATLGGLLEHTLAVMRLAAEMAALYPRLDRDLLLAGAFLHDLGKLRELETGTGFRYTDEGNLIGHLVIGAALLDSWASEEPDIDETLRLKLNHMILSHHGRKEFGSPVVPKFAEALALHFADNLDSKLKSVFEVSDREKGQRWSSYQAQFDSYLFLENESPRPAPPDERPRNADLKHRPLAGLGELAESGGRTGDLFGASAGDERERSE